MLEKTGLLNGKPVDIPMDLNQKLLVDEGAPFKNPGRYRWLVDKLNYLARYCMCSDHCKSIYACT